MATLCALVLLARGARAQELAPAPTAAPTAPASTAPATPTAPAAPIPPAPPVIAHFQLANGLDVILEEDHRQPRVAVLVAYELGWRDDPPGLSGLAHLVEHLSFRRSRHLNNDHEGFDLLQRAGASDIQGTTTPDFTLYQAVVPSGALPLALFVESERMAFTLEKLDDKALNLERSVIDRETKLRQLSTVARFAQDNLNAFFGEQHPYFDAVRGRTELDDVELAEAQAFFQRGYRPDAAHLVLVGDFQVRAARKLIETYFGPIVAPKAPRRPSSLPAAAPARTVVLRKEAPYEQLSVTWAAPDPDSDAGLASELFAHQLRKNLRRALLEESFSVTRIETPLRRLDATSLLMIKLTVREDIKVASALFEKELGRIWDTDWAARLPVLRRELVLAKRTRRESLLGVAIDHLLSTRAHQRPFNFNAHLQSLARVTPQHMQALSQFYAGDKAMVGWLLRVGDTPDERARTGLVVEPR